MLYKLRAECLQDVVNFIEKIHFNLFSFNIKKDEKYPDVDFEFETDLVLDEIILNLKDIEDSHVMYQTVNLFKDYTGERDTSI